MIVNTSKLGGTIKASPKDFIVEEIWGNRVCEIDGSPLDRIRDRIASTTQNRKEYLHFTLVKENWETIRALNYIRRRIHVSLQRFGIAGMKDRRAITAQRVSLWSGKIEDLRRLILPDMALKDFEYMDSRITLGTAIGNRFTITIRNITKNTCEVDTILHQFKEKLSSHGIPNFYGPQRFSGRNAEVGCAIKNGELKKGVELILQKVQKYIEDKDIDNIPKVFWYEKNMLRHLAKHPNDYAGALRRIPKRILRLYTHAYQSMSFNERLNNLLSNKQVTETILVEGFHVPKMPELSTIPFQRRSFLVSNDFDIMEITGDFATVRFSLRPGEYASTLLSRLVDLPKHS